MSNFFIDRPIFAWVIALVIMLLGALSIVSLPINQYPTIAPPAVTISINYPGASAQTLQDSVVQVIEQQLNGIDNLRYIASESNSDGSATITVTLNQGANPDTALVQVQSKVNLATSLLPQDVQQQGIRVTRAAAITLIMVGLVSEDGSLTKDDLSNYMVSNMQDAISRTAGVGDVQVFGAQYAMRIWLDPLKLNNFKLTPSDVQNAISGQNVQVSSGQLGAEPAIVGQQLNATIVGKTRLRTAEQFGDILLKVNPDGSKVRLGDVATVGLGGDNYRVSSRFNGKPATGIAVRLANGANALDTAKALRQTVSELEPFFPPGMKAVIPYDTIPVVTQSISGVVQTLFEAVALVFLVMFLFLQNFRATLITTMTVPVVLLGTFGILAAAGFSINTLTMFGMVLAIGLLVDDAIVVVENVERVMTQEGLSPKDATKKSMGQIQGALVGIALVLSVVLLPMAFFGGSTGVIYQQFSITIVSAMALSVLVALIFTPALCATLLKPVKAADHGHPKRGFFGWFNRTFDRGVDHYEGAVGAMLRRKTPYLLIYGAIVIGMVWLFARLPGSFLPAEDQGLIFVQVQTPPGSSTERTQAVLDSVLEYLFTPGSEGGEGDAVSSVYSVNGSNFASRGQSSGVAYVMLKPWSERSADNSVSQLTARAQKHFSTLRDAKIFVSAPPAIRELGNATGFNFYLQDRAGLGHDELMAARSRFIELAGQSKVLTTVRANGLEDEPQYQLLIDDEKASALGISLPMINNTLSMAIGGSYVNDFIDRGRIKKVYIQGQPDARMSPEDLKKWYVRNDKGAMVPFSAFAKGEWIYAPPKLARYNGVEAIEILGNPAPGYSTGEAMAEVEALARQLPAGFGISWTGLSYEERLSGSQAPALYVISLLMVFLCLAALYESWSIPMVVLLVVPLGIFGALLATTLRGLSNDVYFQIGLLVTVGLAAKNAILIVEFAKELHEQGHSLVEAATEACRMRLRPIIMTSMAFILGVVPLAIATGAGSGSQNAMGTVVLGGMISATVLVVFWVPLFFVAISSFRRKKEATEAEATAKADAEQAIGG